MSMQNQVVRGRRALLAVLAALVLTVSVGGYQALIDNSDEAAIACVGPCSDPGGG